MTTYSLRWGGAQRLGSHAPAIVGQAGAWTPADLLGGALTLEDRLPAPGGQARVVVSCRDRLHFAIAALGCWRRGFVVALPPPGEAALAEILTDPHVVAHVHDGEYDGGLDARALIGHPANEADLDLGSWGQLDPAEPLALLHTSGTSGQPIRVTKTAGQLWAEAAVLAEHFAVGADDCILSVVPHQHIYGLLFGVLLPWWVGARLVREIPLHGPTLADAVARHGVTRLVSTPAHLRSLDVLDGASTFDGVRTVFSSGAPLGVDTLEVLASRFGRPVTEILGSTETGGMGWRHSTLDQPSPPWQTLAGVRIHADSAGRMWVDSPFLGPIDPRPFPTQDRVVMRPDGTFEHLGRLDDIVKIGGKRLSLRALEGRLLGLAGVEDAAVLSEPSLDGRGHRVRAVVVAPDRTVASLRQELKRWFDPTVLPRNILRVSALPREDNGKLRRDRLLRLWKDARSDSATFGFGPIEREGSSRCGIEVTVPRDLVYFQGHFPDHPILPGVAQLEGIVLSQARRCWPELGRPRRVVRLKFRETIEPDDHLRLHLTRGEPSSRVVFELSRSGRLCSSGILEFCGQEEGPA